MHCDSFLSPVSVCCVYPLSFVVYLLFAFIARQDLQCVWLVTDLFVSLLRFSRNVVSKIVPHGVHACVCDSPPSPRYVDGGASRRILWIVHPLPERC